MNGDGSSDNNYADHDKIVQCLSDLSVNKLCSECQIPAFVSHKQGMGCPGRFRLAATGGAGSCRGVRCILRGSCISQLSWSGGSG